MGIRSNLRPERPGHRRQHLPEATRESRRRGAAGPADLGRGLVEEALGLGEGLPHRCGPGLDGEVDSAAASLNSCDASYFTDDAREHVRYPPFLNCAVKRMSLPVRWVWKSANR